jgi:hypothetical protein
MKTELVNAFAEYGNKQDGNTPFFSGGGSTLEYTANVRKHLPIVFDQFDIKTFLDAPCGSLEWMKTVLLEVPKLNYIGADIVEVIVNHHNETYKAHGNRNFVQLDITDDALPSADMWMVRDCFFHLSHALTFLALKNFLNSDIKYILTTSHFDNNHNSDIIPGGFGLLNLFIAPFNFPEPLYRFNDWIIDLHGHPPREMCVWSKEQIATCTHLLG